MNTKSVAVVLVIGLLMLTGSGLSSQASENQGRKMCSLEPIENPKFRDDIFDLYMFPGWFKPRCDLKSYQGNTRIVVKLTSDGRAILNPKNEPDGASSNTIELRGLSLENATMLWGAPKRESTFDLISETSAEKNVFHLDTKFVDGKLSSYRLRGIGICKPEWTQTE
jgi:hypothetical protein